MYTTEFKIQKKKIHTFQICNPILDFNLLHNNKITGIIIAAIEIMLSIQTALETTNTFKTLGIRFYF